MVEKPGGFRGNVVTTQYLNSDKAKCQMPCTARHNDEINVFMNE